MTIDVQKILDFIAGLLEKGFHTFVWIRPQATFTLCIALSISKFFLLRNFLNQILSIMRFVPRANQVPAVTVGHEEACYLRHQARLPRQQRVIRYVHDNVNTIH